MTLEKIISKVVGIPCLAIMRIRYDLAID